MRWLALPFLLVALLAAGCGGGETVAPTAETVDGQTTGDNAGGTTTQPTGNEPAGDAAQGKGVFASNGCGGCHIYAPAGASGAVGPSLDETAAYVEEKELGDLNEYLRTSITNPNEHVHEGYGEGIMPSYDNLADEELNNLVAFLAQDA